MRTRVVELNDEQARRYREEAKAPGAKVTAVITASNVRIVVQDGLALCAEWIVDCRTLTATRVR